MSTGEPITLNFQPGINDQANTPPAEKLKSVTDANDNDDITELPVDADTDNKITENSAHAGLQGKSSIDGGTRRNNLFEGEAGGGEKANSFSPTMTLPSRNSRRYTIDETVQ